MVAEPGPQIPDSSQVLDMVIDVWASLVGDYLPEKVGFGETVVPDRFRTVCIAIKGEFPLGLFVDFASHTESYLAGAMHDKLGELLEADELNDSVGEFVNILGGEVLRALGGGYHLGLPVISEPREKPLSVPEIYRLTELEFTPQGHAIHVVLAAVNLDRTNGAQ